MKFLRSKKEESRQTVPTDATQRNIAQIDGLHKQVRLLWEELRKISADLSVARRDVSRIDRRDYRQAEKLPSQDVPDNGQKKVGIGEPWR